MRLSCRYLGQQRACRWSAATVSPRIQISDEIISSPGHLKFTLTTRSTNHAKRDHNYLMRDYGSNVKK